MSQTRTRAFTLIELLVVVAVIALLIGVLLPALGKARSTAWKVKGASMQKQMITGMVQYGNNYDFAIPGLNTSGLALQTADDNALNRRADLPVQSFDFITPAFGDEELPPNRADRFIKVFRQYTDPSMRETLPISEVQNASSELTDKLTAMGGLPGASFLMPLTMQWAGVDVSTGSFPNFQRINQSDASRNVVDIANGYTPRIDKVGQASAKVAVADGYWNVTETTTQLDMGIWADIHEGGAFGALPPVETASLAYTKDAPFLDRSYRHGKKMNIGFFDAHVETVDEGQSRNPNIWYPTGSIFSGNGCYPEVLNFMDANDRIN